MDSAPSAISPPITPSTGPTWRSLRDLIQTRGIHGKVIVSAELGLNHNGNPSMAMRMIERAAEVGCHAVKVQNYRTGDVVRSRGESIEVNGIFWNAWELFSRCELECESLGILQAQAESCGLLFHSTPTNEQGIRDLESLGVRVVKIASDMLPVWEFVRYARQHIPNVVASAGCVSPEAVLDMADPDAWVTLHCVRQYPTPASEAHLEGIDALRDRMRNHLANRTQAWAKPMIGYSDHTEGIEAAVSAVRDHGAVWIECHVTLDHKLPGPDHRWSKDFTQMAELIRCLRA